MPNVRIVLKNGDHTVEIETTIDEAGYAQQVANIAQALWTGTQDDESQPKIQAGFRCNDERKLMPIRADLFGEFMQPDKVYNQDQSQRSTNA